MKTNKQHQRGFAILSIVLMAVVLLGVVTAVVSMSRSSAMSQTDVARPYASGVIAQGNNLALAFQRMEANGVLPANITYGACTTNPCSASPTTVAANDLLNPSNVSLTMQTPPDKAFNTAATAAKKFWFYKSTATGAASGAGVVKVPGVGTTDATTGSNDFVFVLTDLDQTVCQEINRYLTNSTTIPLAATAGATLANFQGGATAPLLASAQGATDGSPATVDMTAAGSTVPSGQMQGCVATSDSPAKYVYYVVAEPR